MSRLVVAGTTLFEPSHIQLRGLSRCCHLREIEDAAAAVAAAAPGPSATYQKRDVKRRFFGRTRGDVKNVGWCLLRKDERETAAACTCVCLCVSLPLREALASGMSICWNREAVPAVDCLFESNRRRRQQFLRAFLELLLSRVIHTPHLPLLKAPPRKRRQAAAAASTRQASLLPKLGQWWTYTP